MTRTSTTARPKALLYHTLARTFRAHQQLTTLQSHVWGAWTGLPLQALDTDELSKLAGYTYHYSPYYRSDTIKEWEERWWKDSLPPTPAHILLGACGAGREILWLLEAGYQVDAFDPAASLVSQAVERVGDSARVWRSDYRGFADDPPATRYDAVILGWGSFSHILDTETRTRTLTTAASLCPRGPILLSWLPAESQGATRRARQAGERAGAAIRRVRQLPARKFALESILPWAGPIRTFEHSEITELARQIGRSAQFGPKDEYPHATLTAGDS